MIIYPDIELQDGQCVNLVRGRMEEPIKYDVDPLDAAKQFEAAGAEALHLVDLDGVRQGGRHNADAIRRIIEAVKVPVQVGGGIRTIDNVNWWFDHGADRVVLGTAAVKDRWLVENACAAHPGKVLVSVDAREGRVVIEGWRETTAFTALELAKSFEQSGVSEIIYTDIDRDDELYESSVANTSQMGKELNIPVISSGLVKTLDDVSMLKYMENIAGCVIGRALFNGSVDLKEALEIAKAPYQPAEFI
jgi:phosphoribosylformimino-5-aminoimidazole carboxamide ribotide isomerase